MRPDTCRIPADRAVREGVETSASPLRPSVAGARVDRIAAQAKTSKRAIYDYFGDKSQLFPAVLELLVTDLAQAVPPGDENLPAHAERLFDYHLAHPEALRSLMWEVLERVTCHRTGPSKTAFDKARAQLVVRQEERGCALPDIRLSSSAFRRPLSSGRSGNAWRAETVRPVEVRPR